MIGAKRALADIWPVNKKRFFVLVDPESVTTEDGAPSCVPTIAHLVAKKAKVIIASSFGNLDGIQINVTEKQRETALKAFADESGFGYTNFFANLSPKEKLNVLAKFSSPPPSSCAVARGTGKTTFFASRPVEEKVKVLSDLYPNVRFTSNSASSIAQKIETILSGVKVTLVADPLNAFAAIAAMNPGEVVVLENLRFYQNETSSHADDRHAMAEILASYADVFVNDSFATAHEVKASTVALPKILRHGAAGLLMEKELSYFKRLLTHPARPTGVVVAGTHLDEKLRLVASLVGKVDKILVAGEVALPFLAAKGLPAGKGFNASQTVSVNGESIRVDQLAARILRQAAATGVQILLPIDHVTHNLPEATRVPYVTQSAAIPTELYGLDVGPATVQLFAQEVRSCRTVFWSGTLGHASIEGFETGTVNFAKSLASAGVFSVVGGRHTTKCVRAAGVATSMSHLCSGGVACLEVLQANLLPAVEAISDAVGELDQSTVTSVNELLRHLPLFSGCTAHQLSIISKKAVRRVYTSGDFLVYDGDRFTSMFVVAKGSLVACPKSLYGKSTAVRRVAKGHAIGLYEFITLHASAETVQVSENDTVVYQLSHAALNEAINESPELTAQLVVNLSEPLRVIALGEHSSCGSECAVFARDLLSSRVPKPVVEDKASKALNVDIVNDVITTAALHKVALEYRPFRSETGTCAIAQPYGGIAARLLLSVLRNVIFHQSLSSVGPIASSVLSAVATTPLRLLASGTPLHKITTDDAVDAALVSGAVSLAPAAAHYLFVSLRSKHEVANRSSLNDFQSTALAALCRVIVGVFAFPLIARRSADLLNLRSFAFYLLKQVASLLLETVLNRTVRQVAKSLP